MSRCTFCDEYNLFSKQIKRPDCDTDLDVFLEVSLIQTIKENDMFLSSASYQPYPLNYCPVCGKKLNKN